MFVFVLRMYIIGLFFLCVASSFSVFMLHSFYCYLENQLWMFMIYVFSTLKMNNISMNLNVFNQRRYHSVYKTT